MTKTVTVELSSPITGHNGPVSQLVFREPRYGDVMALGDPAAFAQSANGMIFTAEKDEVVKAYIERLIENIDGLLLSQLNLADTLKVREVVHNFFGDARRKDSSQPATSSSSTPNSSMPSPSSN